MKTTSIRSIFPITRSAVLAAGLAVVQSFFLLAAEKADDWTSHAIAPVANPIFFETPLVQSEVRPIFAHHRLDKGFLGVDAYARLYAVQLRYAVTDRLAIIATKDGYIEFNADTLKSQDGWADLAAGLKYNLYRNDEQEILVTPGFTIELPTGNRRVFQGNGSGELNLFVSAMKGWKDLHLTANVGGRVPFDMDDETANIRYGAMVDYYACQWFIPFVSMNAFTTVSDGTGTPMARGVAPGLVPNFTSEGFDLINFGSVRASGRTQAAWGLGFRSRLCERVDVGFAYERGFAPGNDIFRDRFTVDMIWRF